MGGVLLFAMAALVALNSSVNAQQYTVNPSVYQTNNDGTLLTTECANLNQVLLGLVSTSSITQINSADALSANPGTAFEFQTSAQTIPVSSLTLKANCLDFCRQYAACTAVQYQAACNNVAASCVYITTMGQLTLNSRGTTSTASCTSGITTSGRSVYVKYCTDKPVTISGSGTTNPVVNPPVTATNTWSPWAPWYACFKTDASSEKKTRRRLCNGNACTCPSGGTCVTSGDSQYQDEEADCTVTCTDNTQVYINYCSLEFAELESKQGYVWNQCNPCRYKYCQLAQGNWVVQDRECSTGTRYDTESGICVQAESDEKCHYVPAAVTAKPCSLYEVNNDIRQYEQNNIIQTCSSGLVFWTKECQCVPGPGVSIARQYIVTSILCEGTAYDAGGYIGSANPYPSGRKIEFSTAGTTVVNSMCQLVGASNARAGGLTIGSISGLGEVLNPAVTLWFSASDTSNANSNKQVLLTNRKPGSAFAMSVSPDFELYIQSGQLYFTSSNLGANPVSVINTMTQNMWYCVGVVFDHAATKKEDIKSLTIRIYLKQKGGSMTTPITQAASSTTVTINSEAMKVGYSNSGTGANVAEYFTGLVDSFTFVRNKLITPEMMNDICAKAPDSY